MGFYEQLLDLESATKSDGSLAQLVEIEFSKRLKQDGRPKEYYYLKDLCNPIQTYWAEKRPDVKRSREVANKLARGNRLQRRAFAWMRKMPDYVCEETHLYGEYQKIERVVGKFDLRLGDSLVEFKTKPDAVPNAETVFKKYPQDLEQVLFYAAMSPMETKTHYLVFQLDHRPYALFVFRVVIRDLGVIRNSLKQRRDNLDKALQNSDPSVLGRCRYLESGCDYEKNQVCHCSSMKELNLGPMSDVISLTIDEEKKAEFERFRDLHEESSGELYNIWNLLTPRKCFLDCLRGISDYEENDGSLESSMEALRKAVYRADELKPNPSELEKARANCLDLPIYPTWRWIAVHHTWSGDKGKRVIPALLRASRSNKLQTQPFEAYKVQLTVARIATNCQQGAVIILYPNVGDKIQAFTMSSEESVLRKGRTLLRTAINSLDDAIKDEDINRLDLCPGWVQKIHKKCSPCPDYCEALAQGTPDDQAGKS